MIEPQEHIEVEEQTGRIFPVSEVGNTINKMIDYNNQLVSFSSDIETFRKQMEEAEKKGIGKINLKYITKIAEKFCKRINYWLALLRYYLIKGLSGIFKCIQKVIEPIESLINVVRALLNIDITTIVQNVINFASSLLNIFLGPYNTYIQFGRDTAIYTPQLVEQATNLKNNVQVASEEVAGLGTDIQDKIEKLTNSSYLTEEIRKRVEENLKDVDTTSLQIKFEAITMDDILNSDNIQKPKWKDFQ